MRLSGLNNFLKSKVEKSTFGVFAYLGEKFGIQSSKLRIYFIYTTFITLGSPLVFYFFVLFWINLKKYLRKTYTMIFE
ncbi:MAG: PspC family transcriptional regulator [Deltaproteobacteria bacterium]